jgi:hypothetical protein
MLCPAVVVDQQIARHTRHPCGEGPLLCLELAQRAIQAQKHLLRHVFRLVPLAGESVANVIDPARVEPHEFFPGKAVALEALLDQLRIWLQRFIRLAIRAGLRPPPL